MKQYKNQKIYYCKLNGWNYALFGVLCLIMIPFGVYNSLKAANVATLVSYYPALEISSACVSFIAVVFILSVIIFDRYIITDNSIIRQRFFVKSIPAEKLLTIRKDEQNGLSVLYYMDENSSETDGIAFLILSVRNKYEEKLIEDIRKINPHVSIERIGKNGKAE